MGGWGGRRFGGSCRRRGLPSPMLKSCDGELMEGRLAAVAAAAPPAAEGHWPDGSRVGRAPSSIPAGPALRHAGGGGGWETRGGACVTTRALISHPRTRGRPRVGGCGGRAPARVAAPRGRRGCNGARPSGMQRRACERAQPPANPPTCDQRGGLPPPPPPRPARCPSACPWPHTRRAHCYSQPTASSFLPDVGPRLHGGRRPPCPWLSSTPPAGPPGRRQALSARRHSVF